MNKHMSPDSSFREALPGHDLALHHPYVVVGKETRRNKGSFTTGLLEDQRKQKTPLSCSLVIFLAKLFEGLGGRVQKVKS